MSTTTLLTKEVEKPAAVLTRQTGGQLALRKQNAGFSSLSDKVLLASLAAIVVWYAPMSFTYFLGKETSVYGDEMLAALVSREFAYGKGSGHPDQILVLLRNIAAMLPHTISGTVAIVVGLAQFNRTLQFKYPVVHRNLGRLYGVCCMTISWSAFSFLADAIPKKEVFSGECFAMILSSLAVAMFTTMTLAVYAIWNRDIGSHREFMAVNYSLMLSAPVLRVCWVILGRLWGETKWTVNLYSSVFAGPFLLATPIFFLRQRHSRPVNETLISNKFRLAVVISSLLSLLFLAPKLSSVDQWSHRPAPDFWSVVPQWTFHAVTFTILAQRAKRKGDMRAYTAWTTYQNGMISGPIFAVPTYYLCRHVYLCSEGLMGFCTVVGAYQSGLFASHVAYVTATSTFANPRNRAIKGR